MIRLSVGADLLSRRPRASLAIAAWSKSESKPSSDNLKLAQATKASFVLLGRTPLADEPACVAGVTGDANLKKALLADATREEVRTRSMAIFGIGIGSSFLLALIIGPLIAAYAGVGIM